MENEMKRIPNILSFSRIVLALFLLLFVHRISTVFIIIFVIAMLTDLFDGFIARKTDSCSEFGSRLDSIADFILDAVLIKMVIITRVLTKKLMIWLMLALGIGIASPIINFIKHKKVFFIHSLLCKVCMWMLFGIPFAVCLGFGSQYLMMTLTLGSFAMLEIVLMSIFMKEPDPDARSLYSVIKNNRAAA